MKSFPDLEPDEYRLLSKHFNVGREGYKINKILLHHNAANLTIRGCYDVWQTRQASAHYQVDANGRIGQLVRDANTAWHAGTWNANLTSIGIEHANNRLAPAWTISEATLENGAHLVAALCVAYGLGRPAWRKNVFPHQDFQATACPGAIAGTQRNAYMARAGYWYDRMTGEKPSPSKPVDKPVVSKPAAKPSITKLSVDGYLGALTVGRLQQVLGTTADGVISGQDRGNAEYLPALSGVEYTSAAPGSQMVIALQKRLGVTADGHLGPKTIKAWQRKLGVKADGYLGSTTARAIQKALNTGKAY